MKRILKILFLIFLAAGVGMFLYFFFNRVPQQDAMQFIPNDAFFVVESDDPVGNWETFSDSRFWQQLKKHDYFEEINEQADYLTDLIKENEALSRQVGQRKLVISAHPIPKNDYDFLYILDLKAGAKVGFFKDVILAVLEETNQDTRINTYEGHEVVEIKDDEGDILHIAFQDNILLTSYNRNILLNSFKAFENPEFSRDPAFLKIRAKIEGDGVYQFHFNFGMMSEYLKIYMDDVPESMEGLADMLEFMSFDIYVEDNYASMEGYALPTDSVRSYLTAMGKTGTGKFRGAGVLPANTSFVFSMCFDDFNQFMEEFQSQMKADSAAWESYSSNRHTVEKFLNVDLDKEFLSWIGNEVTMAVVPTDSEGVTIQSYVAVMHTNNMSLAEEGLGRITKQIKKRTPVKFKKLEHREHEIQYLEMKGAFRLFFGRMFDKFEKPRYVFLDDFVVFSNRNEGLMEVIDAYEDDSTMSDNEAYTDFFADHFSEYSNIFIYLNSPELLNTAAQLGDAETKKAIIENRDYISHFPMAGFQLKDKGSMFETKLVVTVRE